MRLSKMMVITGLMLCLVLPGTALADDVDKCFAGVDKATAAINSQLSGWDMATYAKKSKSLGGMLDKSWRDCAKCLAKKYKSKGQKKSDLDKALMRGQKAYNETDGEKWMGQGIINKCIPMAIEAYQGSEKTQNSADFKKLSKKDQKKELKNIQANQKKIINGTVGSCFKKENAAYVKRLKDYLKANYEP